MLDNWHVLSPKQILDGLLCAGMCVVVVATTSDLVAFCSSFEISEHGVIERKTLLVHNILRFCC